MSWLRRTVRTFVITIGLAVFGVALATPAWAHAELVQSNPANGSRLSAPPTEIRLTFTESIDLIDGGLRLLDHAGTSVATPEPVVAGSTITWPMPPRLAQGAYVVAWRVVSSDGHPVAGAFSFGVGADASRLPELDAGTAGSAASTAPLPVLIPRLAGYLALAALAGVAGFVLCCAPGARSDPTLQRIVQAGVVVGFVAALASLLLQGPYAAGQSSAKLLDPTLIRGTLRTPFGLATLWRLALYATLAATTWRLPTITGRVRRCVVAAGVVGIAVTIAESGHGASGGSWLNVAVVSVHALTAALWVGGLAVLTVIGRSVERRSLVAFSRLAMTSVLVVVATGLLNSIREVHALEQLFLTRYGLLLLTKLLLVAGALAAAAVSRNRVGQRRTPLHSVRVEAGLTLVVLAATALLSMTTPPPTVAAATSAPASGSTAPTSLNRQVSVSLNDGRSALLAVLPATTKGSILRVAVTDRTGAPLTVSHVRLTLSNPARGVGAIPVTLVARNGLWEARYRFPLDGTWRATLTVENRSGTAVVAAADVEIVD